VPMELLIAVDLLSICCRFIQTLSDIPKGEQRQITLSVRQSEMRTSYPRL
jgi:hypothetical protein